MALRLRKRPTVTAIVAVVTIATVVVAIAAVVAIVAVVATAAVVAVAMAVASTAFVAVAAVVVVAITDEHKLSAMTRHQSTDVKFNMLDQGMRCGAARPAEAMHGAANSHARRVWKSHQDGKEANDGSILPLYGTGVQHNNGWTGSRDHPHTFMDQVCRRQLHPSGARQWNALMFLHKRSHASNTTAARAQSLPAPVLSAERPATQQHEMLPADSAARVRPAPSRTRPSATSLELPVRRGPVLRGYGRGRVEAGDGCISKASLLS